MNIDITNFGKVFCQRKRFQGFFKKYFSKLDQAILCGQSTDE